MAVLTLPLLTEATVERKSNRRTDAIKDHTLFKKMWIHASRQIVINRDGEDKAGKSRMEMGHWVNNICFNCIDLCWHFPDMKNKHKPIALCEATDDSCMGKESRTYGL